MQVAPRSRRRLTGRSTGAPTAGHLAREALVAYSAPRGQGGHPSSPGYLYVRFHRNRDTNIRAQLQILRAESRWFRLPRSCSMDQLIEALKYLSAGLAVLAPLFKLFPGRDIRRPKELEERYARIKSFFDDGGAERHALLVEAAFAAAVGHTKLNAVEIPLVLRQKQPTHFMDMYVRARGYLAPSEDGSQFELKSVAALAGLRGALVALGLGAYVLLVFAAVWLTFYFAPKMALAQSWGNFAGSLSIALLFSCAGAYCLIGASHLHWAAKLHSWQQ